MNTPLQCSVEGTDLVMRIGIGTLAWAAKKKNGGPIDNRVRIADKAELAKDVAKELMREDELGNMPITELLDVAIKAAADSGSAAFVYPCDGKERGVMDDDIIGKSFVVQHCEAREHGDNEGCVCKLIGHKVVITKRYESVFAGTASFHIEGRKQRVRLSELGMPNRYV